MSNVSPGVYPKIIDLSNYVAAVPSTIAFIPALTEKGRDNELVFVSSRSELISEWGEPNIATYGKNYGQGLYNAYNYLGEAGSLYFMRCMSDDASYSNMRIDSVFEINFDTTLEWTTQTTPSLPGSSFYSVCWSSDLNLFCAIGTGGTDGYIITSPDGENWTSQTPPSVPAGTALWKSICWSPELDLFCAVSNTAPSEEGQVITSSDGENWDSQYSSISNSWQSICWSPDLNLFCAVCDNGGAGGGAMTSPDGTNWATQIQPEGGQWRSVCWSPELDLFCAVSYSSPFVMTSPNGTTWTIQSSPNNDWRAVCWSPELGLFCAVADTGVGNRAMTSSDGINWESQSVLDNGWESICWSPYFGLFCAIARTGSNEYMMTSPDGIDWTVRDTSEAAQWNLVCWSPELKLFCAVRTGSTSDAVMITSTVVDSTSDIQISYGDEINSKDELTSNLATEGGTNPICFLYPIGRGQYYNELGVRFVEHANPLLFDVFVMDIYERQSDGDDIIIESFEVSFNPKAKDNAGDSLWIVYILETYSSVLRADMTLASEAYSPGYDLISRIYDKAIGNTSAIETGGSSTISDNRQDFSDWETNPETGDATYTIIAIDPKGNRLEGWLGISSGDNKETINVFNAQDLDSASQSWIGDISLFDSDGELEYYIKKSNTSIASAFISAEPIPLKKGSDGSLLDSSGDLDTTEATSLLANAYAGTIDDSVLNIEDIYFSIVFDCGYPTDVKTQISNLVQTRRDCMAIMDNGDNSSFTASIDVRNNTHTFNNYYCALYEEYNKVYDIFTGQDVWFSPIYHMSYLLPRNDNVAEIWFAAAGFNRAAIDSIKELRFNPKLSQRDQMYLKQLNPIVKFSQGYTFWGQLTTQAKASAMQDINIVRLVLYCKKAISGYCRYFIFEMNDNTTWSKVANDINLFLEDVKNRRGLYSYSVEVGATEYEKKSKKFHVNVTLDPTRVVEQIPLNFFIK